MEEDPKGCIGTFATAGMAAGADPNAIEFEVPNPGVPKGVAVVAEAPNMGAGGLMLLCPKAVVAVGL